MKALNIKNLGLFALLFVCALAIPLLMVQTTFLVGPLIIIGVLTILGIIFILKYYQLGLFLLIIYGSFLFYIARTLKIAFSYGIPFDLLIVLIFFSLLIYCRNNSGFQWKTEHPITIMVFVFFGYMFLQIANPSAVSIGAWLYSARFFTFFLLFYIFIHYFNSKQNVRHFFALIITIAMIAALYGIKQEFFGLTASEWQFVNGGRMYNLLFIWGHMRVFSIFSDPSSNGLFLGFCATFTLILAFGNFTLKNRLLFTLMALIMLYSMSFSGTRTAFALVIAGVALFVVANLGNIKILIGSFILVLVFIILMIGPFYSGPILRMRSTFNLSSDASMAIRDIKRIRLQSYIKTHPIGGGLSTAGNAGLGYSKGHPMAGPYDPDSGYLRTGLEKGWIGLLISLSLYGTVVIAGVSNYLRLKDPELRIYSIAFTTAFFGLSIAHYTQDALFEKPLNMLVFATFALLVKLKDLDE
jgi:hypothetical protein